MNAQAWIALGTMVVTAIMYFAGSRINARLKAVEDKMALMESRERDNNFPIRIDRIERSAAARTRRNDR